MLASVGFVVLSKTAGAPDGGVIVIVAFVTVPFPARSWSMKSTLNVNGWPTDGARGVTSKWTTLRILLTLAGSRRRASWVGLRRIVAV